MTSDASAPARGVRLTELLLPHADAFLPVRRSADGGAEVFRFVDAPPAVVREALSGVPTAATSRPNDQPPAGWLVDLAVRFGGRLGGFVNALYGALRVDTLCVPAEALRPVVQLVADKWPGQDEAAVLEAWDGWTATNPVWTGTAREVIAVDTASSVWTLWWD